MGQKRRGREAFPRHFLAQWRKEKKESHFNPGETEKEKRGVTKVCRNKPGLPY